MSQGFLRLSSVKLRGLAVVLLFIAIVALSTPATSGQFSGVQIGMSPGMYPNFNPDVTDYVVNPGSNKTVQVLVNAPLDTLVSVDGQPFRHRYYTVQVPNVGPGQSFSFAIQTKWKGTRTYHVRRLPSDFPNWTTERRGVPQAEYYVFAPNIQTNFASFRNYVIIADGYGVPIWWYRRDIHPIDAKLLPNGHIAYLSFATSPLIGEVRTLAGTLTQTLVSPPSLGGYIDNHEILQLANGNYLFIVGKQRGPVNLTPYGGPANGSIIDNIVVEVTPKGKLVWQWSAMDHVPVSETGSSWWPAYMTGSPADPYHMNSVEPDGDGYVMSLRHLDALIRIDKATGARQWKIGGTQRPESLKMVGDRFGNFSGQHDARILPDGTLTLHDNGTTQGRAPRGVHFRLDTDARTATFLDQMSDSAAPFSGCCGSARRLPGGNWVMEWGDNASVTELAPDGNVVLRLTFQGSFFSYRVDPIPFGKVSRSDIRQGMDAQYPR